MTWYTPLEMAKRIGFYHSCQGIGSMLAGALQTAFYQELNGRYGIAGWQWTFIINGGSGDKTEQRHDKCSTDMG